MQSERRKTHRPVYQRRAYDKWPVARPYKRVLAELIDQGLVGIFTGVLLHNYFGTLANTLQWKMTWLLAWPFVSISTQSLFILIFHGTPGKRLLGLKIISANPHRGLTP